MSEEKRLEKKQVTTRKRQLLGGVWYDAGESVEVYGFEADRLSDDGLIEEDVDAKAEGSAKGKGGRAQEEGEKSESGKSDSKKSSKK